MAFSRATHPNRQEVNVKIEEPVVVQPQVVSSITIPRRKPVTAQDVENKQKEIRRITRNKIIVPEKPTPQPMKVFREIINPIIASVDIYVVVTTYNRPEGLEKILKDIHKNLEGYSYIVHVYDDASDEFYVENEWYKKLNSAMTTRFSKNNGKRGYWKVINQMFSDASRYNFKYFFQIPDDCNLVDGFFREAIRLWEVIPDSQKICLSTLLIKERIGIKNWTYFKPKNIQIGSDTVIQTQWNDMCYMCTRNFFQVLDWGLSPIPESRWERDKNMSSGVGQQITQRLNAMGKSLYHVWDSLVIMEDSKGSVMNPEERQKHPHTSLHRNKNRETVTVGVASIPDREEALGTVIKALLPQVDRINVFLNGYGHVPEYLIHEKISVYRSEDYEDRGDAGKFFKVGEANGYYFSVDDDLLYPPDYVERTIEKIEYYKRRYVVSYHGALLVNPPVASYYRGRKQFHCRQAQERDIHVHVGGTGVMAFHTDTIKATFDDFEQPNMADIWMAILCQKNKVGIMCLAREYNWINLSLLVNQTKTIYATRLNHDVQTEVVNSWKDWKIYAS